MDSSEDHCKKQDRLNDSPVCRYPDTTTFSVVQGELVNITCDVESEPKPTAFQWTLNNTIRGTVDLKRRHPKTFNVLYYSPRYLGDYGTIMCWGKNDAGVQRIPCMANVIPEGEVTTDMGVIAPSTDEEENAGDAKTQPTSFVMSPAVGVLVGVVVALVVMALIIVIVMRIQGPPPTR
ncbi:uncharacterized protein LOC118190552, partial [Stegodyphus dumicola]|uniref:uncharacterized protein LOC118190552 n=1 Tax=Stegodyphus dumicola TaxID=202533 RepID=UPI0015B2D035